MVVAILVAVASNLISVEVSSRSDQAKAAVADAFETAYGNADPGTGRLREFTVVAEPSTANLSADLEIDVWSYNGTVPGPQLRVDLGDTVVVTLENRLPQATSIHWHGVRVPNAMDGVPGINQDPVQPGESFRYEFVPKDAGTFWYHSHTRGSEQLERGLYGSLVVVDAEDPPYDVDVVWVIDDWLLERDGSLDETFGAMHEITHNGRWGNVLTTNGRVNLEMSVPPGARVRLRMVNASNARVIAPDFDGVDPTGIAVDGMLARQPFDGDQFVLAPGNRLDVEFVMTERPIVVSENFNGEGYNLATIIPEGSAVLRDGQPPLPPSNPAVPQAAELADMEIDHEYTLDFLPAMMAPAWGFNGRPFPETESLSVNRGELAIIRLRNESQALHPIHVHGQFFLVVAIDGDPIDEGHLRDTVLMLPGQTIDIFLFASDEGTWAVHCHIQEHADAGMMTLLEVR